MRYRLPLLLLTLTAALTHASAQVSTYNQMDENGNITQRSENFNKHNNDTTGNKEVPKGRYHWTVDRKFGDITRVADDSIHHLYMNTTFNTGLYGQYNTTGSNFTARLNRIYIDRPENSSFIFTQPYDYFLTEPDQYRFVNTLSPYTRVDYDNCGDKQNGEDRLNAKFAVNVNKRLGLGFSLRYDYARGYFSNQNASHFNATLFASYIGDRYQMHALLGTNHQKVAENGGVQNDAYITHPESFPDSYDDSEIATVLSQNWNRNDNHHLFLTHRYNVGFYRKVKMTEEEIKARKFAQESKAEKAAREAGPQGREVMKGDAPKGRPKDAKVMGAEPERDSQKELAADSTRIKVDGQAAIDSLNQIAALQAEEDSTMKREYVPVTSFIHTLELNNFRRIYQAYNTPDNYYLNKYYNHGYDYANDSVYDITKHTQVKNTFAIALLEGFNKYMKAGLKGFITHEYRSYELPEILENTDSSYQSSWKENAVSVGGQLSKTQGQTLHFNVQAEVWLAGEESGQLKLDANTDLNFRLFGDTVTLAAHASFHRLHPTFYYRTYHSKNLWWDNSDLSKETRTRIEGTLAYRKTNTQLRVAVEGIQNYTYLGMSYDATTSGRTNMTAGVYQESSSISVLTAQLHQNFRLGPLNWENVVTYQNSSNKDVLPLPTWNFFTNLFLKFRIARVLDVELGADATYFTKYYAPDFCPMINQFAVQKNEESRIELGGYPFLDVYANMRLKGVRFFVMMTNVLNGSGNHMKFLAPHYPVNGNTLHFGVSWPFFN